MNLFDELERLVNSDDPEAAGKLSLFISEHGGALGAEYRRIEARCVSLLSFVPPEVVCGDLQKAALYYQDLKAENVRLAAEVETLKQHIRLRDEMEIL